MGLGLEVIAGFTTAAGATTTALTMNAGNSATIRNTRLDAKVLLLQVWTDHQAAGFLHIRSPRLHDNVRGIRIGADISEVKPTLPYRFRQPLVPQDTLVLEQQGSATAGDIETAALLIWYEDIVGIDAHLVSAQEVMERMVQLVTVENTLSTGTAGGYSGEEAITSESDLLIANTEYALVGFLVDSECAVIRWRGADTGNLGVGGPGDDTGRDYTRSWFLDLARAYEQPMVPVFNSANRAGILLDASQDENGADPKVTSILAQLAPGPVRAR